MYDLGVPVPPDLLLSPDGDRATAVNLGQGLPPRRLGMGLVSAGVPTRDTSTHDR